jgi:hypothetical protein
MPEGLRLTSLSGAELAEIAQVVKNGSSVAGELTLGGKFTHAGAVDALIRTVRYLQARLAAPAPTAPAPAEAPSNPRPPEALSDG